MKKIKYDSRRLYILIIPALYLIWSLIAAHLSGPYFLTRSDPEYPYLLNGLNFARLDFSRIGHTDHPGTPFQMITGLFIQVTYWLDGQGALVDDVISRPEHYLASASLYLTLITVVVMAWLGKIVMRQDKSVWEAIILQSSVLMNVLLIDLPSRYIPDRMMAILVLVLAGLCYKFIYFPGYNDKKFALHSGILTGIGLITKVNFLPLLAVPLILINNWKKRLQYFGIFILSAGICLIPIYDKISGIRYFLTSIIKHEGLYGQGAEQVINLTLFGRNILDILSQNNSFLIAFIASVIIIVVIEIKPSDRKTFAREYHFLIAFLIVSALGLLITAKHYKDYYIIPVISLTGFTILIIFNISRKLLRFKGVKVIFVTLLAFLIFFPVKYVYHNYPVRVMNKLEKMKTHYFYKQNVSPNDFILIEPTWYSGPIIADGLTYGLSYVAYRHYYYNEYERYYPNVLTWNSTGMPIKYMHMTDVDNQAILKSGKSIYVLSSPWRHAADLCNYFDSCGRISGITFLHDTVYRNPATSELVIRLSNISGWATASEMKFGFETVIANKLVSDDGQYYISGEFEISDQEAANGIHSMRLSSRYSKSPDFIIQSAIAGDYIEITIKRRKTHDEIRGNIVLSQISPDKTCQLLTKGKVVSSISSEYELIRLIYTLKDISKGAKLSCNYEYTGQNEEFIDDLAIRHYSCPVD